MNLIRKTKNKWLSLSTTHILGLLVAALSVIGCDCGGEKKEGDAKLLTLELPSSPITEKDKGADIVVKNTAEQGSAEVDLTQYELRFELISQLKADKKTQGTGSKLTYQELVDGKAQNKSSDKSFAQSVAKLAPDQNTVAGGVSKTVNLKAEYGPDVEEIKVAVKLVKIKVGEEAEKEAGTGEITFSNKVAGPVAKPIKLEIEDLKNFTGTETKFKLKNAGEEDLEHTAEVEVKVEPAGFALVKTDGSTAISGKLADFVQAKITKGGTVDLTLKVDLSKATKDEDVTVKVTPKGGSAVTQKVKWTKPSVTINWDVTKNPFIGSQVTEFTIASVNEENAADITVQIDADDKFTLVKHDNTDKNGKDIKLSELIKDAKLAAGTPVSVKLKVKDFSKVTDQAVVKVSLQKGGATLASPVDITWTQEKVEIERTVFAGAGAATTFQLKPMHFDIPVAEFANIKVISEDDTNFKLVTNASPGVDVKEATLDQLISGTPADIKKTVASTGTITLKLVGTPAATEKSKPAPIKIKRGDAVLFEGTITWKKEDIQLDFEVAENAFKFAKGTALAGLNGEIKVKNAGKADAVQANLKVVVTRKTGTNSEIGPNTGAGLANVTSTKFGATTLVPHSNASQPTIYHFKVDPKADASFEYVIQLEYDSEVVTDASGKAIERVISWEKSAPKLKLESATTSKVGDGADDKKFALAIKNDTGGNTIKVDALSLKVSQVTGLGDDYTLTIGANAKNLVAPGTVEGTYTFAELGLTSGDNFAAGDTLSKEITLTNKAHNVVSFKVELLYTDESGTANPIGSQTMVWKNAPKFNATITSFTVVNSTQATANFVFTNDSGREVANDEVKDYKVVIDETGSVAALASVNKASTAIGVKATTLEHLSVLTGSKINDGAAITIPVELTRGANDKTVIAGLLLVKGSDTIAPKVGFTAKDWNALPTLTVALDKTDYLDGDRKLTITLTPSAVISLATLKAKGKLVVTKQSVTKSATSSPNFKVETPGAFGIGAKDVNTVADLAEALDLKVDLGTAGVNTDLNFKKIESGDTVTFEIKIVGLDDVAVVNPVTITAKKTRS